MEATMHEARTGLSKLVARATAGEEAILATGKGRIPVARIVPIVAASVVRPVLDFSLILTKTGSTACWRRRHFSKTSHWSAPTRCSIPCS